MGQVEKIVQLATKGQPFAKESEELGRLFNKIFKVEWNKVLVHLGEKTAEEAETENLKLLNGE